MQKCVISLAWQSDDGGGCCCSEGDGDALSGSAGGACEDGSGNLTVMETEQEMIGGLRTVRNLRFKM